MLSKNQISFIRSLGQKKFRNEHNLFIIEGSKIAIETLNSNLTIHSLYATKEWISKHQSLITNKAVSAFEASNAELERITQLNSPSEVLILAHSKTESTILPDNQLILALDHISDPGNLGTIIRIADWFGINHIVCSQDTVELYNPKVIQSTMGSFIRVEVHYCQLDEYLSQAQKSNTPIYGAFLDGNNIYNETLPKEAIIVIGNESKGINPNLEPFITKRISIPSYAHIGIEGNAESLNASIATALTVAEFKRQGN